MKLTTRNLIILSVKIIINIGFCGIELWKDIKNIRIYFLSSLVLFFDTLLLIWKTKYKNWSVIVAFIAQAVLVVCIYVPILEYILPSIHFSSIMILDGLCFLERKKFPKQDIEIITPLFETARILIPYVVNNNVVLNRNELVQVLAKSGNKLLVRKYNGDEYTIDESFIKIELY
ncbi:hypothetical protein TCON_1779 [Astathelohania contejeani]|uniref:Uncharacterized protein n=1 Tax=Astathelohania contejeani TaxID=164912 RepID=A0ABQ7HXV7_9MICR|nr:hypothetical protein TCON_1779 [Thelohania contejeani]